MSNKPLKIKKRLFILVFLAVRIKVIWIRTSVRVQSYCIAKGYQIVGIVKEVGSGCSDTRKQLIKLLEAADYNLIVVEHKDRLSRVGFNYIQVLLKKLDKEAL